MPSVAFAVRGDSLSARYAPGGASPGVFGSAAQVNAAGAGIIGAGYIDLSASLGIHGAAWPANGNFPTSNKFSVLVRAAIINSATPTMGLWALGFPFQMGTAGLIFASNTLYQDAEDLTSTADIGLNNGSWSPTLGRYYDIVSIFDMRTSGVDGSLAIYVDGVLINTNSNSATWALGRQLIGYMIGIGAISPFITATRIRVNEFVIWDGIIDPTSGGLNLTGETRSSFISCSQLDGSVLDLPAAADVKHDVTFDNGNRIGTYRGLDLWNAVVPSELGTGISKLQNGSTIVGTYGQLTFRQKLSSILGFIGETALTDDEFGSLTIENDDDKVATYNALRVVLITRGSVSTSLDRLKSFYAARGIQVSETNDPDAPVSEITLGFDLSDPAPQSDGLSQVMVGEVL